MSAVTDFNSAFVALCSFLLNHKHTWNNFSANTFKSFYTTGRSTKPAYDILVSAFNNIEFKFEDIHNVLASFFKKFDSEFVSINQEFYKNTDYYNIFVLLECAANRQVKFAQTVFSDEQLVEISLLWTKCDDIFKTQKVTIKTLQAELESIVNNADNSTLLSLLTTLVNKVHEIKEEGSAQVTNLINSFKLENNKDFESKYKHIINSIKNNFKLIIKQQDQMNNLETHLNSSPFTPPKSLSKERFPMPHFNKDKSFLFKHEECTIKCQKLFIQLSIDHLKESIEATEKLNMDFKTRLEPEFNDFLFLKSTFKLDCTDINGLFEELKSQAKKLVEQELVKRDNKTKNAIANANVNNSLGQNISSDVPTTTSSPTTVSSSTTSNVVTAKTSSSSPPNQTIGQQQKNKNNRRFSGKRTNQSSENTTIQKDTTPNTQKSDHKQKTQPQQQQQQQNQKQQNKNSINNTIHSGKRLNKNIAMPEQIRNQIPPQQTYPTNKQNLPKQNVSTNPQLRTYVQPASLNFPNFALNNGFQGFMPQNFQWAPPFQSFR